jgi:hypothetical protein
VLDSVANVLSNYTSTPTPPKRRSAVIIDIFDFIDKMCFIGIVIAKRDAVEFGARTLAPQSQWSRS